MRLKCSIQAQVLFIYIIVDVFQYVNVSAENVLVYRLPKLYLCIVIIITITNMFLTGT